MNSPARSNLIYLVLTFVAAIHDYHDMTYSRVCSEVDMCGCIWDELATAMARWLSWNDAMKERKKQ